MLTSLFIQNYALIETLDIRFEPGFSVITGETGAGKSIILGAIGLPLGQRADSKSIKHGASNCIIEAHFELGAYDMGGFFERNDLEFDGNECIVRREITASGKSRAFINDTPASVNQLKELGEMLIDVHSQHQNLLLNKENFQLNVIDILAGDKEEVAQYKTYYAAYRKTEKELEQARKEAEQARTEEDYITFQLEQLENAALKEGEQEQLEQEADTLGHAEEIKQTLYQAENLLNDDQKGIVNALKEATHLLENVGKVYPESHELTARMESCYIELKDISNELGKRTEDIEFNPERLDYVNERLNTIYDLQQKHRVKSLGELLQIEEKYRDKLNDITHSEEHIQALQAQCARDYEKVSTQAERLSELRRKAAVLAEKQMKDKLIPLGIPNVQFKVELTPKDTPDETGTDKINFIFSANKNGQLQPISQVASGGEIARVMLSLKAMISGAVKLPTIVFDEIDTGVSGSIAEKMAHIMQDMGAHNRQVISITHLPQIAALGTTHYKVYKEDRPEGTTSHIIRLDEKGRIEEIAHMLSGATLTDAAINNAKELLNHTQSLKK
ncbi:MAG: DNA repair protein RecN [Paraprevotella sp.]|nr:DNA repair protein RecN [Paraprevotella sp.]